MLKFSRLIEVLHYEPETGLFRWLVQLSSRGPRGAIAGCMRSNDGRCQIRIDGCVYLASRLAWLYVTGHWPKQEIDHVNLDKADDRWLNLRIVTRSQNQANTTVRKDNKLGLKGVSWNTSNKGWVAQIQVDGRKRNLGTFNCPAKAHSAYLKAANEGFGDFARGV